MRFLTVALRAARPNELAAVAERASAILNQVAVDSPTHDDPELANLLDEVRAEIEAALGKG